MFSDDVNNTNNNGHDTSIDFTDIRVENGATTDEQEKTLIHNVMNVAKLSAEDVMLPRADIVAIDVQSDMSGILSQLAERPLTRIPVYEDNLDNIIGCIHMKDLVVAMARKQTGSIKPLLREVIIVSPSMHVLDLLLEMRETQRHLAMVVDEFGGIDGLITISDLIGAIVGEIKDEHDSGEEPRFIERADGTILADARVDIDDLEERFGSFLTDDEREDIDTLGGLCMTIAGHMPVRGELLSHESGLEMEIIEADPRRIKLIRIHATPNVGVATDSSNL